MASPVVVGAFAHETNTFVPDPVDRADFRERRELFGDEVTAELRDTETAVGGVVDVAEAADVDLVQTVAASATPGGVVTDGAYEFYAGRIVGGVREHRADLDGVLLALHGAMVTETYTDAEGELLERVRDVVGEGTPVVVTLDLHANVSERMVDAADAVVAYETYPHLDQAATGRRGMELLLSAAEGTVSPTTHRERPPMVALQPRAYTPEGPMARLQAHAREVEGRPGVLKASVVPGFYHADVPEMGFTTPVVTDGDPALTRSVARELAGRAWGMREEFVADYPGPEAAVDRAVELRADLDSGDGPVVMADFGSNPGGGGAADGTTILREMLRRDLQDAGWAIMHDPEVVAECVEAGVGSRVVMTLGGKTDDRHGAPIEDLAGYVRAITDGRYVNTGTSHGGTGVRNDIGRTVRLECGTDRGVTVVVAERRASAFDAEVWRHVGVQPERLDYICIPSLIAFLGDYEPLSGAVVLADTPGASAVDPARFDYDRIPRPLFPLDEMADGAYPDWE